jgi:hypothetical protein
VTFFSRFFEEHFAPFPRRTEICRERRVFLPHFELFDFFHVFCAPESSSKAKRRESNVRNFRKEALFQLFDLGEENLNSETMNNTEDSLSDFKKKNRHFQVWIPSKLGRAKLGRALAKIQKKGQI